LKSRTDLPGWWCRRLRCRLRWHHRRGGEGQWLRACGIVPPMRKIWVTRCRRAGAIQRTTSRPLGELSKAFRSARAAHILVRDHHTPTVRMTRQPSPEPSQRGGGRRQLAGTPATPRHRRPPRRAVPPPSRPPRCTPPGTRTPATASAPPAGAGVATRRGGGQVSESKQNTSKMNA